MYTKIGILGGGQLGMMLCEAAKKFPVQTYVLDSDPNASSHSIADNFVLGDIKNESDVLAFGKLCDVITIEIEHVNVAALVKLKAMGKKIIPDPEVIKIVQDKGLQKLFYQKHGIPTASFSLLEAGTIPPIASLPCVQKSRKEGYDGKGVVVLRDKADLEHAFSVASVLETLVDVKQELSVIVAQNEHGDCVCFDPVELMYNHEQNLVDYLQVPASISDDLSTKAKEIALRVATTINCEGVLAVELFITHADEILVNEIAPRPHNSGHQTIEANRTSQYTQHINCLLNLPLTDTTLIAPTVMWNVVGEPDHQGKAKLIGLGTISAEDDVFAHFYGKKTTKPFRKMGHITVVKPTLKHALDLMNTLKPKIKVVSDS